MENNYQRQDYKSARVSRDEGKTLHYNYVIFNSNDNNKIRKNSEGYYTICLNDLIGNKNIHVVSQPLDYAPTIVRYLFCFHHSERVRRKINIPGRNIWYPYYFKNIFNDDLPLCFIILNPHISVDYLKYLRKKHPKCRIVAIHRDLVKIWKETNPDFFNNPIFDLEMTFDENEAKKYGMLYFSEFESKMQIPVDANYPLSDVFFAGKAKDRLDRLMEIYHLLTAAGIKCHYYLTEVPESKRENHLDIEYADKQMTYKQMLYYTVNTQCLLDINQKGAVGYTSRFLEAVMYGKKLITDNNSIKRTKFYNPNFILCINKPQDIDVSFIKKDVVDVDYHYNDEFSPKHLIEQIDLELSKKDERRNAK